MRLESHYCATGVACQLPAALTGSVW